jgi:hypothetical protein
MFHAVDVEPREGVGIDRYATGLLFSVSGAISIQLARQPGAREFPIAHDTLR